MALVPVSCPPMQTDANENIIKTQRGNHQINTRKPDLKSVAILCNDFLDSLQVTPEQAYQLRMATIQQEDSPSSLWQQLQRCRLTASNFGLVAKRKQKFDKLVETILYRPPPSSAAAIEWGTSHESNARESYIYEKQSKYGESYKVSKTELFINIEQPWLAATPDGIVEDPSETTTRRNGLLEIKCPYSARNKSPTDACKEINRFCCTLNNNEVTLKTTHNYYFQIQGQLAITQLPWCDLYIWTPHGSHTLTVDRDDKFWLEKVYPKLHSFYHQYLLPELADPVYPRGQAIRRLLI